jgi:hypothetical protein
MSKQDGYLRVCVDAVEAGSRVGVPELDRPVCCPTSRGKEVGLERAPGQRLDCCTVGSDPMERPIRALLPDVEKVVVPS